MSDIKKIVIFGATGNTGLCCLQAAIELGFEVTAFVRDEGKVPEELKSQIEVVTGDTNNSWEVDDAVQGRDGVVIALGTRNDLGATTVISDGTKNILSAMEKYNVRRVSACISAFLFWDRHRVPEKYHPLTEDHERMLQYMKDSNTEWTAVLPPHITETPGAGSPTVAHDEGPGRTISKHDLGRFLVTSLTQEEHVGRVCGICDKSD